MDHLPLPKNPILGPLRVPFVCETPYSDADGEWITYPTRAGCPRLSPPAQWTAWIEHELVAPTDDRILEIFLQKWLYFGLLYLLLAGHGLYDAQDYLGYDEKGQYVHTRTLLQRLQSWQAIVRAQDRQSKLEIYNELLPCFQRVEGTLGVLGRSPRATIGPEFYHPGFNPAVKVSMAALGDTLVCAAGDALLEPGETRSPIDLAHFGRLEDRQREMILHGWCPSEVAIMRDNSPEFSAQWYYESMRRPDLGVDHQKCNDEICVQMQIDPGHYQPQHATEGCTCLPLDPALGDVACTLESKSFLLLRISGDTVSNVKVEIVRQSEETPYVALSHVWADGVGNQIAAELPRWQLLRL